MLVSLARVTFLHETRTHNEDNYYICVTAKSGSRMYTALV